MEIKKFKKIEEFSGVGPEIDFAPIIARGAVILDVRTVKEYKKGHVGGSLNIPLDLLGNQLSQLEKDKPIIICCASGTRSASAKDLLEASGFKEVYNAGSCDDLKKFEQQKI